MKLFTINLTYVYNGGTNISVRARKSISRIETVMVMIDLKVTSKHFFQKS